MEKINQNEIVYSTASTGAGDKEKIADLKKQCNTETDRDKILAWFKKPADFEGQPYMTQYLTAGGGAGKDEFKNKEEAEKYFFKLLDNDFGPLENNTVVSVSCGKKIPNSNTFLKEVKWTQDWVENEDNYKISDLKPFNELEK
jgi:hypothetical protein